MTQTTFADRVFVFYQQLVSPDGLPPGVTVMNPHANIGTREYVRRFLTKYFADNRPRFLVFGINPGRFGAGLTGINFTDPVALAKFCDVPNDLPPVRELSSIFVYQVIDRLGGPRKFFADFFLTALSPLGFVKNGKNYNFYDEPKLLEAVQPFIVESVRKQIALGGRADTAIILGTGQNQKVFTKLNEKHKFFKKLVALEHPRFIMQYRRKKIGEYLEKYEGVFRSV